MSGACRLASLLHSHIRTKVSPDCIYAFCPQDETVEREQGGRNRKRPRAETESAKEEGRGADHKQIVRIRAKVHCTAAGLPGLDAPAITDWKANAGEDSSKMPEWHPLEKVTHPRSNDPMVLLCIV